MSGRRAGEAGHPRAADASAGTGATGDAGPAPLEVLHLSKYFGTRRVLHDVSLRLGAGERLVILGDNGSGKSTLLGIAAGVLEPDAGGVARAASIGFAPEKPDMPDHLLVVEWLDVVASLQGAAREAGEAREARESREAPEAPEAPEAGEGDGLEADPLGLRPLLGKRIAALSLGQRQRVSLAAALLGAPEVLVMDEPTNGLDAASRDAVIARLLASTALVATHDRALADAIATRVVTLRSGVLVPGA